MSTILSIQSSVAYGHVGNSAATFPLMRLGVEVFPVYTVHFANSTSYGPPRGPVLAPEDVAQVVQGIDDREALSQVDAVLTGYQGSQAMGQTILDAVRLVRERQPKALYCADPVMGDVGRGFFVAPGIPEFLRDEVIPVADVVTPNQFELEFLTGRRIATLEDLLAAADALRDQGPSTVLVTSAVCDGAEPDTISMVAVSADEAWVVQTPRLAPTFAGSGDITAAVFLAGLLRTGSLRQALEQTASVVYAVLKVTADSGRRELSLVAAQDQIAAPQRTFEALQVR